MKYAANVQADLKAVRTAHKKEGKFKLMEDFQTMSRISELAIEKAEELQKRKDYELMLMCELNGKTLKEALELLKAIFKE